jgi:hypothetical protein
MSRNYPDWITAFMDYASFGEAPRHMYFWTAVSTISGALRRKVWVDQGYFKWFPNFYVILVAPPGIVSKSTTAGIGMDLLKRVPGIKFGPSVVTMQALLSSMAEVTEAFEYEQEFRPMSALTIESSEFGNLLNPHDKDMVDMLVNLWDGKEGALEKKTKHSGNDTVVNPFLNIIACTTPAWIAGNFPEYMIGGGFTSRCIFVYADKKAKYVAYPGLEVPATMRETADKLVADLEQISMMTGSFKMTREAVTWGESWYRKLYRERPVNLDDERFGGYIARKQTHLHKLAMVLSASISDDLLITDEFLSLADTMLADLEPDMAMVFSKIGKTEQSVYVDRMVEFVRKSGTVSYTEMYRYVHAYFPSMRDFEDLLAGCVRAGLLKIELSAGGHMVKAGPAL